MGRRASAQPVRFHGNPPYAIDRTCSAAAHRTAKAANRNHDPAGATAAVPHATTAGHSARISDRRKTQMTPITGDCPP
jgi:hypothetical protein